MRLAPNQHRPQTRSSPCVRFPEPDFAVPGCGTLKTVIKIRFWLPKPFFDNQTYTKVNRLSDRLNSYCDASLYENSLANTDAITGAKSSCSTVMKNPT